MCTLYNLMLLLEKTYDYHKTYHVLGGVMQRKQCIRLQRTDQCYHVTLDVTWKRSGHIARTKIMPNSANSKLPDT